MQLINFLPVPLQKLSNITYTKNFPIAAVDFKYEQLTSSFLPAYFDFSLHKLSTSQRWFEDPVGKI